MKQKANTMAGLLLVGGFTGFTMFLGALSVKHWNESRCTSSEAWFHDWIKTGKKTTYGYESDGQRFTATRATMKCRYCNAEKDMVIADTKPEERVDFGDDCSY